MHLVAHLSRGGLANNLGHHRQTQRRARVGRHRAQASSGEGVGPTTALPLHTQLWEGYQQLQNPARYNVLYTAAREDFSRRAILAYECGCTEGQLLEHLRSSQLPEQEVDACARYVALVWTTLLLSPKSITRWSAGTPVSPDTLSQWQGFVKMILVGYFDKRWAWYPVGQLQMELAVMTGRALPPCVVDEYQGLVYATLGIVAPQFPRS